MATVGVSVLSDDRLFCESVLRLVADAPDLIDAPDDGSMPVSNANGAHKIAVLDARMSDVLRWCATLAAVRDVILVGAEEDDAWAEQALKAGAHGILTKTSRGEDLVRAIHVVAEGGIWARRRWVNASLHTLISSSNRSAPPVHLDALLSKREREVFHHAAMGLANKELADRLAISEATVKVHLTHIFQKLGVSGRAALAAAYHGLLAPAAGSSTSPLPPAK